MISAVVLSHNDENSIATTLASLAWCDEIILIDDYSEDKTVDIARKNHCVVYKRHLSGDFAAQRNFGLEKAKHEWVLFVDSDEVVSKALAEEIKQEIAASQAPRNDKQGYYLKRRDHMWGKVFTHGETGSVRFLRLAKKNAGVWARPVHEVWRINGEVSELSQPLEHFPHPNVAQFLKEINTYSSLRARELYQEGVHVSLWQVFVYPTTKFLVNFFWRLGFLDGTAGAVSALMMSFHSFLVRGKLWELWNNHEV